MLEVIVGLIREISPYEQITEEAELIKSGILNSLSIAGLIAQLEGEFDVEIPDDTVTADNFSTPVRIMQLVAQNRRD